MAKAIFAVTDPGWLATIAWETFGVANGKIYYALEGKTIATPSMLEQRPDAAALAWHAEQVFQP